MGRFVREVKVYLDLTAEEIAKSIARDKTRKAMKKPTQHELRFAERLEKCPVCKKTPRYLKISCYTETGYSYKMTCDLHAETPLLSCGDWFDTPCRAGRDWNERVRKERMGDFGRQVYGFLFAARKKLTRQQVCTLKGQIFAGDAEGALKGLKKLIGEEVCRTCERNDLKK